MYCSLLSPSPLSLLSSLLSCVSSSGSLFVSLLLTSLRCLFRVVAVVFLSLGSCLRSLGLYLFCQEGLVWCRVACRHPLWLYPMIALKTKVETHCPDSSSGNGRCPSQDKCVLAHSGKTSCFNLMFSTKTLSSRMTHRSA